MLIDVSVSVAESEVEKSPFQPIYTETYDSDNGHKDSKTITVALVGNPNSGKSKRSKTSVMQDSLAMVLSSPPKSFRNLKSSFLTQGKPGLSAKYIKAPYNIDKNFSG